MLYISAIGSLTPPILKVFERFGRQGIKNGCADFKTFTRKLSTAAKKMIEAFNEEVGDTLTSKKTL